MDANTGAINNPPIYYPDLLDSDSEEGLKNPNRPQLAAGISHEVLLCKLTTDK